MAWRQGVSYIIEPCFLPNQNGLVPIRNEMLFVSLTHGSEELCIRLGYIWALPGKYD